MTRWLEPLLLLYFLGMQASYLWLLGQALLEALRQRLSRRPELDVDTMQEAETPPITVLAPAYNEEATVVSTVQSLQRIRYPALELMVINDGSADGTLKRLIERFELEPIRRVARGELPTQKVRAVYRSRIEPRLIVVDKENGGKADALNTGIEYCRSPLICCVDTDTIVDQQALLRMVEPFLYEHPPVVAAGGTVRLANGATVVDGTVRRLGLPGSWLARFQLIEYVRAFMFGRMGFNTMGGSLIISGAFGLFRRDAVVSVGGYASGCIGEDMELVVRLHRRLRELGQPARVVYVAEPVCYTQAPETLRELGKQRDRWQRGLADSLWRHRRMFLNPRYGATGLVVFPIFVLFEFLGPIIELGGYLYFGYALVWGQIDVSFGVLFFLLAFIAGAALSVQSLFLDGLVSSHYMSFRLRLRLLMMALIEPIVYRPITLLFRIRGLWKWLRGDHTWGTLTRTNMESPSPSENPS